MAASIIALAQSTISLLLFTTLGVFGAIDSVDVHEYGLSVENSVNAYFSFGGIAYHDGGEHPRAHELGHLRHERELGILYLPIAGLTSLYGFLTSETQAEYFDLWTERTAEQYAKEIR